MRKFAGLASTLRWDDARNLLLIAFGWALLLIVVPAEHEYPLLDDFLYAGSVRDMLNTGRFIMPAWSQTNLVGLTLWGVLWAKLFGFSFTTLTYSVQALALMALFAFYGIARLFDVSPWAALLGTALLGFNTMYVHLSYMFMTDVPFLALVLVACYCYVRALQGRGNVWLWLTLAGVFAGWSFLVRQFGLLVPMAFVLYLLFEGLVAKRWRWRHILMTALVPGLIIGVWWYFWGRHIPPTIASLSAGSRAKVFLFKPLWLRVFTVRALIFLPFVAFFAWAAIKLRWEQRWLLAAWAMAVIVGMYAVNLAPETAVAQTEPPFVARFGPVSLEFPEEEYTFGLIGSIIRQGGIDFDEFGYTQEQIWSPEAWRLIWVFGVALGILLLAKMSSSLVAWSKEVWRWRAEAVSPLAGFYLLGFLLFVGLAAIPGDVFARYVLAFVPFVILFVVRGARQWGRLAWAYSVAALAVLATFTVLAKADHVEHQNTRWEAGLWMEERVGAVRVGWNWSHWGHMDSETYLVADTPVDGFRVERQFPYLCRLCGFTTRYVLAQSRADMPPLPEP